MQIGELTGRFTNEFMEHHSNIDYRNIKGLRNYMIHDYTGIIYEEIYDILKEDVPTLEETLSNILANEYSYTLKEQQKYISYYVQNRKFLSLDNVNSSK